MVVAETISILLVPFLFFGPCLRIDCILPDDQLNLHIRNPHFVADLEKNLPILLQLFHLQLFHLQAHSAASRSWDTAGTKLRPSLEVVEEDTKPPDILQEEAAVGVEASRWDREAIHEETDWEMEAELVDPVHIFDSAREEEVVVEEHVDSEDQI